MILRNTCQVKLLFDTHIILWYLEGNTNLNRNLIPVIKNPQNKLHASMASLWEVSIKVGLGKLLLDRPFCELKENLKENDFKIIDITFSDTLCNESLPLHHRDPFDRILISQAISRSMTLVSQDSKFKQYPVKILEL
nr:type II toxin-antitoxin system VapC family toxin [Synechocystis sp. LEGE 06083]